MKLNLTIFETGLELDLTPEQNAKSIVEIFGVKKDSLQSVKELLEKEFVMAIELHENLINALGIPSLSVGYGYNYLSRGESPSGLTIDDFEHISGDRTFYPQ